MTKMSRIFPTYVAPLLLAAATMAIGTIDASAQRRRHCSATNCSAASHQSEQTQRVVEVYEYDYVEHQPQFPGGHSEMLHYINSSRRYPADAYSRRVQGRVLCEFIVGVDGAISNVRVVKGVEESLNREAIRVISEMPRWLPGRVGTDAVPVHCLLPIPFRL